MNLSKKHDGVFTVGAVIVAAGNSQRMVGDLAEHPVDKIFADLLGSPVISYSLDVFQDCPDVDEIVLVLSDENIEKGKLLIASQAWGKITSICKGGVTRQDSVMEGISQLGWCDFVIIHDGARPCVSQDIIKNGLSMVVETGAAIPVIEVKDTVKQVIHGVIHNTIPRDSIKLAQTPQIFRYELIKNAIQDNSSFVTDESSVLETLGHNVLEFPGSEENIKITTPIDLKLATLIMETRLQS